MSTSKPLYFPKLGKMSDSSEQVLRNHFLVLQHLLNANVEKSVSTFYEQSVKNDPDFPDAKLCQNPYIVSTIANEEKNSFPDIKIYSGLKNILTPFLYSNIHYLLNGDKKRFICRLHFGIVTQKESTDEPFIWEGPSRFIIYNQGIMVTINPTGIYVSGTGIRPRRLKQNTSASLIAELNKALIVLKQQ